MNRWLRNPERKNLLRWSVCLYACVAVACLLIGMRYLGHFEFPNDPLGFSYVLIAYIGQFLLFSLIPLVLIIVPLAVVVPVRAIVKPTGIIVAAILVTLVLLDSLVFSSNRFHFNALTIRILGFKTWGFGFVYFAIFVTFLSLLSQRISRFCERKHAVWPVGLALGLLVVVLQGATHVIHMWADANAYTSVTRLTPYLPLFYPAVDKRFMQRHGLAPQNAHALSAESSERSVTGSDFKYPRVPLVFDSAAPAFNVVFILVDDMRADLLNDTCAPNLSRLGRQSAIRFAHHYSGGNSTRAGLFSLFYGLSVTYWEHAWGNRVSPVLIDEFQKRQYRLGIFTSAPLDAPAEMDATTFSRVRGLRIRTEIPNDDKGHARDSAITDQWRQWLDTSDSRQRFFGFLFYDHLCSFDIAPGYEHASLPQAIQASHDKRRIRQARQMRYVDSLIAQVIADLASRGKADSTVIVITSDHGEEFDDNGLGFTGHGSAYSTWQLHVPLLLVWPAKTAAVVLRRTSHFDIVPTIIGDLFKCRTPAVDYCSGSSLFSDNNWQWLVSGSYYNYAIIEPDQVTIHYPGGYYELRDNRYRVISSTAMRPAVLTAAFHEIGRFFKQ